MRRPDIMGAMLPLVDVELVRRLVGSQFPQWAELAVHPVEKAALGWDNWLFRLGADLAARLPRRQLAADLVAKEQRWLPILAPTLPLPVSLPLGHGARGHGYPWEWSVCPWLPGEMAFTAMEQVDDWGSIATELGNFIAALQWPAPEDAPRSQWRGIPLAERDESTRARLTELGHLVDGRALRDVWARAVCAPRWAGPDVWLHGDLHPGNLLIESRRLSAVVDFGDLCAGDPATDLLCAWMLLPGAARPAFRESAGVDDATWERGRGWALCLALVFMAHSADNQVLTAMGERAIAAILSEGDEATS